MRHRCDNQLYGYKQGPRKALLRSLVYSLVEHGRIHTTLAKAKEVRRHAEKAITQAKKKTLHSRRILLSRFPNKKTISLIIEKLGPKFSNRSGGYTRIIKTMPRKGDMASMAYLEFINYSKDKALIFSKEKMAVKKPTEEKKVETKAHEKTSSPKEESQKKRFVQKKIYSLKRKIKEKARRKMKAKSRKENFKFNKR